MELVVRQYRQPLEARNEVRLSVRAANALLRICLEDLQRYSYPEQTIPCISECNNRETSAGAGSVGQQPLTDRHRIPSITNLLSQRLGSFD